MLRKLRKKLDRLHMRIWWTRVKRFIGAATPLLAAAVFTMIAVIVSAIGQAPAATSPPFNLLTAIPWWIKGLALVGFIGLIIQAFSEYQRRTHDPTWVLKYQDIFESENFIELRKLAVDVLMFEKDLGTCLKKYEEHRPSSGLF